MIKLKQMLMLFLDLYVIQINEFVGAVKVKVDYIAALNGTFHYVLKNNSTVPVETHTLHTKFGANRRIKKIDAEIAEKLQRNLELAYPELLEPLNRGKMTIFELQSDKND